MDYQKYSKAFISFATYFEALESLSLEKKSLLVMTDTMDTETNVTNYLMGGTDTKESDCSYRNGQYRGWNIRKRNGYGCG